KGCASNDSLPDRRAPEPCEGLRLQRFSARPSSAGALRRAAPPTILCPTVERRSPAKGCASNDSLPDRRAPEPCEGLRLQRFSARPSSAGALRRAAPPTILCPTVERRSPAKGCASNDSLPDRRAPEPCEGLRLQRFSARPSSAGALRRAAPPTILCPTVERRSPAKGCASNDSLPDRRAPEPCEGLRLQRFSARPSSAGALRRAAPPTILCPTVERRSPAKGCASNDSLPDRRAPEPCEGLRLQRFSARPSSAGALRRAAPPTILCPTVERRSPAKGCASNDSLPDRRAPE